MTGTLSGTKIITGSLSTNQSLSGSLSPKNIPLSGTLTHPTISGVDPYEGVYVIDALTDADTTLPTKRKFLSDDITVNKIQYIETTNPAGGQTVYIG